jgi:hypothetical protein
LQRLFYDLPGVQTFATTPGAKHLTAALAAPNVQPKPDFTAGRKTPAARGSGTREGFVVLAHGKRTGTEACRYRSIPDHTEVVPPFEPRLTLVLGFEVEFDVRRV